MFLPARVPCRLRRELACQPSAVLQAEPVEPAFGDTVGPGEFKLDGLWGDSPGPAWYLSGPYLTKTTLPEYKNALIAILKDLPEIEGKFDDQGRLAKIERAIIVTLTLINSIG